MVVGARILTPRRAQRVHLFEDVGDQRRQLRHRFEIPLDLAEEITGFRLDQMGFDDDIPLFNALELTRVEEA